MEDDFMIQRNRLHLTLELQCKEQKSLGLVALFIITVIKVGFTTK